MFSHKFPRIGKIDGDVITKVLGSSLFSCVSIQEVLPSEKLQKWTKKWKKNNNNTKCDHLIRQFNMTVEPC